MNFSSKRIPQLPFANIYNAESWHENASFTIDYNCFRLVRTTQMGFEFYKLHYVHFTLIVLCNNMALHKDIELVIWFTRIHP